MIQRTVNRTIKVKLVFTTRHEDTKGYMTEMKLRFIGLKLRGFVASCLCG